MEVIMSSRISDYFFPTISALASSLLFSFLALL